MSQFRLINSNHHVQTLENGSLAIRLVQRDQHEGRYLCEADNGLEPSLVKSIRLTVHQQAHFASEIQVSLAGQPQASPTSGQASGELQQQAAGGSARLLRLAQNTSLARLLCAPLGDPPLQLDWLKDGRLIHSSSSSSSAATAGLMAAPGQLGHRFHVNTRPIPATGGPPRGLESELLLSQLGRHDAGLYTCSARNAYSSAERHLRLLVQEPPEAPNLLDAAHVSSRSVALRWLAPFDGNAPILKYVVEYKRQPPGECLVGCVERESPHELRPLTDCQCRPRQRSHFWPMMCLAAEARSRSRCARCKQVAVPRWTCSLSSSSSSSSRSRSRSSTPSTSWSL